MEYAFFVKTLSLFSVYFLFSFLLSLSVSVLELTNQQNCYAFPSSLGAPDGQSRRKRSAQSRKSRLWAHCKRPDLDALIVSVQPDAFWSGIMEWMQERGDVWWSEVRHLRVRDTHSCSCKGIALQRIVTRPRAGMRCHSARLFLFFVAFHICLLQITATLETGSASFLEDSDC